MQLEHSFDVPVGIDEAWRILLDIERIGPCMPGAVIDSVDGDDFTGSVKVKLGPINLTYKGKASFVEKDETAHRAVIDARGRDARGNGTAAAKVTATLVSAGSATTTVKVNTDLDITGKPAQFGRGVMVDVGNKLIGQFADSLASTITAGDGGGSGTAPAAAPTPPAAGSEPAAPETAASETAAPETAVPDAAGRGAPPAAETPPKKRTTRPKPMRTAPDRDARPAAAEPVAESPAPTEMESGGASSAPAFAVPDELPQPAADEVGSANGRSAAPSVAPREVEPINLLESAGPAVAKRLAPVAVGLVVLLIAARRRSGRRRA